MENEDWKGCDWRRYSYCKEPPKCPECKEPMILDDFDH